MLLTLTVGRVRSKDVTGAPHRSDPARGRTFAASTSTTGPCAAGPYCLAVPFNGAAWQPVADFHERPRVSCVRAQSSIASVAAMATRPGLQRRGRPSKGDRVTTAAVLPRPVREACERAAEDGGYGSLSDCLVAMIAEAVGMPEYAPAPQFPTRTESESLPLSS